MSEQAKASDNVMQKFIDYMENTKDFVLEQAPDVIQQVFRYEKISTIVSSITVGILLLIALSVAYYFWKYPTLDKYESRDLSSTFGVFFPLVAVIPLFIQLCYSIDKLIRIGVAPKYFLLQLFINMKD